MRNVALMPEGSFGADLEDDSRMSAAGVGVNDIIPERSAVVRANPHSHSGAQPEIEAASRLNGEIRLVQLAQNRRFA